MPYSPYIEQRRLVIQTSRLLSVISALLLASSCEIANADLLQIDLVPGSGDGLLIRDTSNGIDWLRLTETRGLSVVDVIDNGVGGYAEMCFRLASKEQVEAMYLSGGIVELSTGFVEDNYLPASDLINLFGLLQSTGGDLFTTQGWVQDPDLPDRVVSGVVQTANCCPPAGRAYVADFGAVPKTSSSDTLGVFLLRPIGETCSFNAQEYFPLHPGNQATYIVNDAYLHTASVPDYTVNVNSLPTRPIPVFPDVTEYYTNDENGLRMHRRDYSYGEIVVLNTPITMTAPQASVGQTFNTNGIQTNTIPGLGVFNLNYNATSSIEAVEPVSVPLGTFTAIRVRVTVRTTGVVLGIPIDQTITATLWVAQHYGPVRRIDTDPSFGTFDGKLVAVTIDTDEDGVNVTDDNCPTISNPPQMNSDGDGNGDACDNCTLITNGDQRDTDADNIGNMCDCDFNQDNFCGGPDFTLFIGCFNALTGGDPLCDAADMNGDGFVGGPDFTQFIGGFNEPPGPSGL